VVVGKRRAEQLSDVRGSGARRGRDHRARAQIRRQEEHGRRARPVEVQRVGRSRVEEDRAAVELGFEMDPAARPLRDVLDRRRRRGSLEQRPDRGEHRRLAARGLADERHQRAGLELELTRRAIALDRDPLQRRGRHRSRWLTSWRGARGDGSGQAMPQGAAHEPPSTCALSWRQPSRCPEGAQVHRRVARLPPAQEALDRRMDDHAVELGRVEQPVAANRRIL
jgi:hypothetical protein